MNPTRIIRPLLRTLPLLLLGAIFLTGCATSGSRRPAKIPFSAKHWNGMDSIEFLQDWRLGSYSRVIIEPIDTAGAKLPPKDENTYEPTITVLKRADSVIEGRLNRVLGGTPPASIRAAGSPPPDGALVLRSKVVEINPGSQAARYFVGFGAGAAWVKISGEVVDGKSGAVLMRFEQQRVGAMGAFGGAYVPMLTDCISGIAKDVGVTLTAFRAP